MPGNPLPILMGESLGPGYHGRINAQFVIDSTGRVLRNTIKIIHGDVTQQDAVFAAAVRIAIEKSRYYPALVGSPESQGAC
jgi:hypothetical protein